MKDATRELAQSRLAQMGEKPGLSRLFVGASLSSIAFATLVANPASAQIVISDDTPVQNPGGQTVSSDAGVTQTVNSGDNIELEDGTNDDTVINLAGTHINNDTDDEDVVIFVDNAEDDIVINIAATGVLQGVDGVIFYEGDGAVITNEGLIEGTGEATEGVVYFDRDSDGTVNSITNSGTITGIGGPTIGVDSLLGDDPSSGTVGDEEGIARFTLVNTGTISNTGVDNTSSDAINLNGDPGTTGGAARGCLENGGALVLCQIELDITNSGTISAARDSSSNAAIRGEDDAVLSGTITNLAGGEIIGASNAITINGAHADHNLTITNAGSITGTSSSGIWITGAGVTIDNQAGGTISGGDEGVLIEGTVIDIDTGPSDLLDVAVAADNISLTNAGTITGGNTGVAIGENAADAMVTNTGTISGDVGISSLSGGTVVNNGTVTGNAGAGIAFSGANDATVTLGAASTTTGALDAVNLAGDGSNSLTVVAGAAVNGNLQGNALGASDTLNLSGMGAGSTLNVLGFDTLNASGGAFTLSATSAGFANGIDVTGGILTLNGTAAGNVAVGDGATFGGAGVVAGVTTVAGGTLEPGDGGVGTLTTGGLTLSADSTLNFDLGDPLVPTASDRIQVNGDLVLDGTLNVADAGDFGIGVYRLIDYTGSLTDNILDLGVLPGSFTVDQAEVQTSIGSQINLVISEATGGIPEVQFWDGVDTAADGAVDGGAGSWNLVTTNWTNAAGDTNFAWNSNFAVFQGAAGIVTVDGDIETTGMQFAADGYTIAAGTGSLSLTEAAASIRVDSGVTATISADIGGGTNGVNKQDIGTLILSGTNSYTGLTQVSGGTLLLNGSNAGGADVLGGATVGGTGTFAGGVDLNDGATIAPGGVGSVGTLTTGSLFLAPGAILDFDLGTPDLPGASDRLQVNGGLELDGTLNVSDAGGFGVGVYRLIDYTGSLTDNGLDLGMLPADFTLDQAEIQTSIANQINLVISEGLVIPDVQFWDGADLVGNGAIDGGSGSWNLTSTNWTDAAGEVNFPWNGMFGVFAGDAGTVTVDDDILFTGLQFMTDGYVIADGSGSLTTVTGVTNIRVDPGVTATISSSIGGTGGLDKLDTGTLVLNGDHSYAGDTSVSGGMLVVNGSIASAVSVESGAALGGSGQVGGLTVAGTVVPGNSIGTLEVAGDVTFAAGSQFNVEVLPDGSSDLLAASGTATLNGGTVNVLAGGTMYDISTDYTILTADDGVTGTFASVNSNLAFLTPTLSYDAESVMLNLTRNDVDFAAVGATANQSATGAAIQSQGNSPLANQIVNLDAAAARDAFDQLSGELHASILSVMAEDNRMVRNSALDRLAAPDEGAIWGRGWYNSAESDGDGNAAGLSRDSWGVMLGADHPLGESAVFGIAGSYSSTDVDMEERSGSAGSNLGMADLETLNALVYVGIDAGGLHARLGAGHGWTVIDTERSVAFNTFSDELVASYSGTTMYGFAEAGYRVGFREGFAEPFAGVTFLEVDAEPFAEDGDIAALRGSDASDSWTIGTLGVRAGTADNGMFSIRGRIGYQRVFGDTEPSSTLRFGNGSAYTVTGAPLSDNAGFAQIEGRFSVSDNATISIGYDGMIGSDTQDHAIMAGFTVGL